MLRTALATLALVLPALTACGGGDSGEDSGAGTSASKSSPGHAATPETPEARQLTNADLEDTLPKLSDMPAGFTATNDDDSDEDDSDFLCGADLQSFDDERNGKASVDYGAQEGLSAQQFSFGTSQFDSQETVQGQLQSFADAVESCDKFTSDGDTYTVSPMSAGRIGDRTVAVKMATTSDGFDVTVNVVMVGSGSAVVTSLSASAGLTGSSVDELIRLTGETVDRYEMAAGLT